LTNGGAFPNRGNGKTRTVRAGPKADVLLYLAYDIKGNSLPFTEIEYYKKRARARFAKRTL
jgi:hypothetical protein